MKPLDTNHNGFRFRSRLEARWAVFMDAIGVLYEYENEGYELDGLCYLPDFWIPSLKCFLEIKPEKPTEQESEKARRLSRFKKCNVFILIGQPDCPDILSKKYPESAELFQWFEYEENGKIEQADGWDCPYLWCECPKCGLIGIEFDGRCERLKCDCVAKERYNYDSPRLKSAYQKAKSYRFESYSSNGGGL